MPTHQRCKSEPASAFASERADDGDGDGDDDLVSRMEYRPARPTDIARCVCMAKKDPSFRGLWWTSERSSLEYRQHYAPAYFRVAVLPAGVDWRRKGESEKKKKKMPQTASSSAACEVGEDRLVGFVTALRIPSNDRDDGKESLSRSLASKRKHDSKGEILAIRSVVVGEEYQSVAGCRSVAAAMLSEYVNFVANGCGSLRNTVVTPKQIAGICRGRDLLGPLVDAGFTVSRCDREVSAAVLAAKRDDGEAGGEQDEETPIDNGYYYFDLSVARNRTSRNGSAINGNDNKKVGFDCSIVDSFASVPGTGNPAAVVLLPEGGVSHQRGGNDNGEEEEAWMQRVAAEFNLSETAFVWPTDADDEKNIVGGCRCWNIRFFTPTVEVALCGHATLASAHVLYRAAMIPKSDPVVFRAGENILTVNLTGEEKEDGTKANAKDLASKISMEFPAKPPKEIVDQGDASAVRDMVSAAFFSCSLRDHQPEPLYAGLSEIGDLLVELKPEDFRDIGFIGGDITREAFFHWGGYDRGLIICCVAPEAEEGRRDRSGSAVAEEREDDKQRSSSSSLSSSKVQQRRPDFLSRFFGPKAGIDEDPVTGSAHCVLAPYFAERLGRNELVGWQDSKRGGVVECVVVMPDKEKVILKGFAVTAVTGKLLM